MAWRDRLSKALPGAFPPAPVKIPEEVTTAVVARAAGQSLYAAMGLTTVVHNFDHPMPRTLPVADEVRKNPLAFAPAWRIAFRMGALPLKVYKFIDEGGRRQRREAMDHAAYSVLRQPNPDITRPLLVAGTVFSMFGFSQVCWLKERRDPFGPRTPENPIIAVWPIPGNAIRPKHDDKRILTGFELVVNGYPVQDIPAEDVCWFRLMPDLYDWTASMVPTGPLGEILDFSQSGLDAMTSMFRSSLLQRLWIDLHGADLDAGNIDRLRSEMEIVGRNPYAVPIMQGGATIETMGDGPNDQLLGRALDMSKELIRYTFGFPAEEDNLQQFYGEVIQPVAESIEQELARSFMPDFAEEAFAQFQFREILIGSPMDRAKYWQTKILSAQATPNEARSSEDEPPLPGGDTLYVPLNLVPVTAAPVDRNPQPRATQGGVGGSEGKGTTPKLVPILNAASAEDRELRVRASQEAQNRWSRIRSRVIDGQSEAMERRLRGVLKRESDGLRSLQAPLGKVPARTRFDADLFEEAPQIMARTDDELADVLGSYMVAVANTAADSADGLVSDREGDDLLQTRVSLSESAEAEILTRAAAIAEHFGNRRREEFGEFRSEMADHTMVQADSDLIVRWRSLTDHLVRMIGANEATWAFERGSAFGWSQAGISEFSLVRGATNCSTGVCSEMLERGRYRASDVPVPLHPGCRCMMVPSVFVE